MNSEDITYKIIGCAMKVHNSPGNGFQEVIYQRCLVSELERAGLSSPKQFFHKFFTLHYFYLIY